MARQGNPALATGRADQHSRDPERGQNQRKIFDYQIAALKAMFN
jgi:hypothetical protein